MSRSGARALLLTALVTTAAPGLPARQSDDALREADGRRLEQKLGVIAENAGGDQQTAEPVVLYQREVNAYLRFQAAPQIPTAVSDPHVGLHDANGIALSALVDLSAFRSERPRSVLDPLRYLSGRLPVRAQGQLHTEAGVGQVQVDSVTVGGLPVPSSVLAELVRYYSRSEEYPDGVDVTAPFDLPYDIDTVHVEPGRAIVVQ